MACSLSLGTGCPQSLCFLRCLWEILQAFCGDLERNRTGRHLVFLPFLHEARAGWSQSLVRGRGEGMGQGDGGRLRNLF